MNFRFLFFLLPVFVFESQIQAQRGPILDRNGTELTHTLDQDREYPFGALGAHIIGYANLENGKWIGNTGVEKRFNEQLAARGEVRLTIDARIQWIAEDAMREVGRGAAVVLDPNTGEILASVSVPSFDPNLFAPTIRKADWDRYVGDKASPLLDRAQQPSTPGAAFLVVTALAGLRSDSHAKPFFCEGGVQYGNKLMKCWIAAKGGRHGTLQLTQAMKRSCNCYFYLYANDAGIENIYEIADLLGLGVPGMNQEPGMTPTPAWAEKQGLKWADAFTAMTGIGQGFVETTPLQMASVAGTVAARGETFEPRLIKSIRDRDGGFLVADVPELRSGAVEKGIAVEGLEEIREGMRQVVNGEGGTGRRAKSEFIEIAGLTGSAQTGKPNEPTNAWFIGFAPCEEPQFAVCVFVQNGASGGRVAAPIARRILERTWTLREKPGFEPGRLEEAKGHFDRIELIEFED